MHKVVKHDKHAVQPTFLIAAYLTRTRIFVMREKF